MGKPATGILKKAGRYHLIKAGKMQKQAIII
jgi:hypothetical protein